jgi:GDP-L-fucose synthase
VNLSSKIFIAGHRGLVGSAIHRRLSADGFVNLLARTHAQLDLTDQTSVHRFFEHERPEYVFLAAAKVGGIFANSSRPAEFIWENLQIQNNVIASAHRFEVKKLMFLGSSCIYPKLATQPMREQDLLTGPLEPTNEAYAIAKIAGLKTVEFFRQQYGFNGISVMPTNLYGPNDNFDFEQSHVLPALMRKVHEAKMQGDQWVSVWGSGRPLREFLFVDDLADACVFLMQNYNESLFLNVGMGEEISILELAQMICRVVGFNGEIRLDGSKPDGTPRKLLDVSRLNALGWKAKTSLRDGIQKTYDWYQDSLKLSLA